MSACKKSMPVIIKLDIGDQLTSISCGHIVVELIKFIAYQRLQIPYSYQWLKQVVNKKRQCIEAKDTFQSEKHFHVASSALENLDFIIKSLLKEIDGPTVPGEVCIALGGTPDTSKEVYRLLLPSYCHKSQCHSKHIASDQKIQMNVFRTLVTSDVLSKVFQNTLPPTNLHVLLKKKNSTCDVVCTDSFVLFNGYRLPRSAKVVVIDFRTESHENLSCCNNFEVFEEVITKNLTDLKICDNENDVEDFNEIESSSTMSWYQSCYVMKGFRDCIVSGSSITNKWLHL
ncbi:uncharacterized protein LOC106721588 [Papilio machaon]|uniref:uncharacterized protein LOC106721588 n=1 Tax=Papilio machaon TaxID=76193 RepID=UPI001E6644DC|nr:uncharacterized protein LOC106721588 [Papilio machaon]